MLPSRQNISLIVQVRKLLETPAPRVLAWNSSNRKLVQAEYIIMEKAKGVPLETICSGLNWMQRVPIVRSIAQYQRAWIKASFNSLGSLYYAGDLQHASHASASCVGEDTGELVETPRFAVGPIIAREWFDLGRARLGCNRGPCKY